jgi:putative polyhydroxyalkanoate system protein
VSRISISRDHKLSHAAAVKVVSALAEELKAEYGIVSRWSGSTLNFSRSGLSGSLSVEPARLLVEVELGFLLSGFRDKIAGEIKKKLDDELLAKAPKSAKAAKRSAK